MAFNPDIVVTEPGSSHVLLIVEAKTNIPASQSEPKLKQYMWEMSCPVGLFVSPRAIVLYLNRFTAYSEESVLRIGQYPSPPSWEVFEQRGSEAAFETRVQSWLEDIRRSAKASEIPPAAKDALSEYVLPSLLNGEIHAAGPRLAR